MHCLGAGTGAQSNSSSSGSPVISNGSASNGIGIGAGVNGSSGSSDNAASSSSSSNDSSDAVPGSSTGTGESIVLGVVRALGILVCEGRIQGPPRGYKEGPHCAAPFSLATNHQCEKDNYLVSLSFSLKNHKHFILLLILLLLLSCHLECQTFNSILIFFRKLLSVLIYLHFLVIYTTLVQLTRISENCFTHLTL